MEAMQGSNYPTYSAISCHALQAQNRTVQRTIAIGPITHESTCYIGQADYHSPNVPNPSSISGHIAANMAGSLSSIRLLNLEDTEKFEVFTLAPRSSGIM